MRRLKARPCFPLLAASLLCAACSENFTINAQENNAQYLKATSGENRTMQFGFRVTF